MTSIDDKRCQDNRTEIYDFIGKTETGLRTDVDKKVGSTTFWKIVLLMAGILASMLGYVAFISRAQGDNAGNIKVNTRAIEEQKERDAIGQKHRETARAEQKAWQGKVDQKLDDIKELIYTHDHNGSPSP